jgi:hypothetical protein
MTEMDTQDQQHKIEFYDMIANLLGAMFTKQEEHMLMKEIKYDPEEVNQTLVMETANAIMQLHE